MSAAALTGLLPPGLAVTAGRIVFEGRDLRGCTPAEMRALRGARIGTVFQEPMTALNPLMRVGDQVAEVMQVHGSPVGRRVPNCWRRWACPTRRASPAPIRTRCPAGSGSA